MVLAYSAATYKAIYIMSMPEFANTNHDDAQFLYDSIVVLGR